MNGTFKLIIIMLFWNKINARCLRSDGSCNKTEEILEQKVSGWPMGIVSYRVDNGTYDEMVVDRIRTAMNVLEETSCIRFNPLKDDVDPKTTWIKITNPQKTRECVHETETDENDPDAIVLVLGYECLRQIDILHSLLHAVGFNDEVTNPVRDIYVRILWENINPSYQHLFKSRDDKVSPHTNVEYDTMSIMHFHTTEFSKNGNAVMMPLLPGLSINPGNGLSLLDKMKLRMQFGNECDKRNLNVLLESCMFAFHNDTTGKKSCNKGVTKDSDVNDDNTKEKDDDGANDNEEGDDDGLDNDEKDDVNEEDEKDDENVDKEKNDVGDDDGDQKPE